MATHDFQEAFKNYRDLRLPFPQLGALDENMGVLRDMLANRRQAFAERLPQVQEKERALNFAGFEQRFELLQAELERVERDSDAAAFATARERKLQTRLDRVREQVESAGSDAAIAPAELARRVNAIGARPAPCCGSRAISSRRACGVRKRACRNCSAIWLRRSSAMPRSRWRSVTSPHGSMRLPAVSMRCPRASDTMVPRVAALTQEQQVAVQELAVAELLRQKERLAAYATQARFAVAQIVDRASLTKEGVRAPAN